MEVHFYGAATRLIKSAMSAYREECRETALFLLCRSNGASKGNNGGNGETATMDDNKNGEATKSHQV